MLIPSGSLIVRADGVRVALVRPDHTVHLQPIEIGRNRRLPQTLTSDLGETREIS